jgi:hypothetical protein
MAKWFKNIWAGSGIVTAIPEITTDGTVNYTDGFGDRYRASSATSTTSLPVPLAQTNQFYQDVTGALQQYQTNGFPDYIDATTNGGTPYAYNLNAAVRFTDGNNYINAVAGNVDDPSVGGWNLLPNNLNNRQPTFRNRIINGAMNINQEYGTTAVTPAAPSYVGDGFLIVAQPSNLTLQDVLDAPLGFKYSKLITVAAQYAPLATDQCSLLQHIEGQNITDFALGTAGAVMLNTSNWIKGSIAGVYAVSIRSSGLDVSYVGTINVTTSWTRVQITLQGATTGTWSIDNTTGLTWALDLGSGTNFNTPTVDTWQAGNYLNTAGSVTFVNQVVGSTLNITGVQLEKVESLSAPATDFESLPIGIELALCQRYLRTTQINPLFYGAAGDAVESSFPINPPMRVSPTATANPVSYANASALAFAGTNNIALAFRYVISATGMGGVNSSILLKAQL